MFLLSISSCIFPESPDNPVPPPPGKAKLPDNHGKDQVLGLPASPLTLISVWVAPPRILQPGKQKRANRANIFVLISSVYFQAFYTFLGATADTYLSLGGTKTSATHRHDHSWRQRVRHSAQVGIIIIVILITMVVTPPSSS